MTIRKKSVSQGARRDAFARNISTRPLPSMPERFAGMRRLNSSGEVGHLVELDHTVLELTVITDSMTGLVTGFHLDGHRRDRGQP